MTPHQAIEAFVSDRAREIARQVVKSRNLQRDNGAIYSAALEAATIALTIEAFNSNPDSRGAIGFATAATREPDLVPSSGPTGECQTIVERCDTCGRFLAFADLCFSQFNYVPLNEFGPEETSWTGPCCRYRSEQPV